MAALIVCRATLRSPAKMAFAIFSRVCALATMFKLRLRNWRIIQKAKTGTVIHLRKSFFQVRRVAALPAQHHEILACVRFQHCSASTTRLILTHSLIKGIFCSSKPAVVFRAAVRSHAAGKNEKTNLPPPCVRPCGWDRLLISFHRKRRRRTESN